MPSRIAYLVSSAMLRRPSLSMMRLRWVSTVLTLRCSWLAICAVLTRLDGELVVGLRRLLQQATPDQSSNPVVPRCTFWVTKRSD